MNETKSIRRPGQTLRRKLLRTMLGTLALVAIATIGGLTWVNLRSERARLAEVEAQVSASIAGRANVLTEGHALALRAMVSENAFSNVQALVSNAVRDDEGIIYGVFVSADGKPWAYESPTTEALKSDDKAKLEKWQELSLPAGSWTSEAPSQRYVQEFGQRVLEVSRPVIEEGEVLGSVRYGFSTRPLEVALAAARSESERTRFTMFLWLLGVGAISTLVGVVLVSRAAKRITEPLVRLTEAADAIAGGAKGVRVVGGSDDELDVLADAFNHMQEARERSIEQLSEAMEQALAASRLKSEFLANMSHEIRTPMNGVIGMIRLILGMPLESKLRRYAETVETSASALMTIINDVLDFSKMEAGKYTLQSVPFDPGMVAQEVAELLAHRAYDKGLEIIHRRAPDVPSMVTGDPDRYRQIVSNLVGNAIKFTEHGEIFVELTVDSADEEGFVLRTVVHDSGIGIASEDQCKLFDAFSQVDGSMVRKQGGTGLGLAISKRLVEMMGGQIGLVSQRGVGSSFWFTIRTPRSDAPKRSPLPSVLDGRRALVVEANRRWCRIIEEHMTAWGLASEVLHEGRAGLHRMRASETKGRVDVVVVGADLRDLGTSEFVRELRATEAGKHVPLIVLTQLGSSATLSEVESEITAQVAKPLRLSELYDRIVGAFTRGLTPLPRALGRVTGQLGTHGRVLVVDDNEINRFVAVEELEQAGYATEVANNGEEALEKIKAGRYVAVLMDCQMPVMDGYTAVRELRAWEARNEKRRVLVIALTAHAMAGERDKVLEAGMDDYLSKPLRSNALEKMLRRHLGESTPSEAEGPAEESSQPVELDMTIDRSPRLIRLFVTRVPSDLEALGDATADAQTVRALAHKLKGSCLAVGAEAMATEAEALQHDAERGAVERFAPRVNALRAGFERIVRLLEREVVVDEVKKVSSSIAPPAAAPTGEAP